MRRLGNSPFSPFWVAQGRLIGGGAIFFSDTSSAGNGTFVVNGAADNLGNGAAIGFSSNATAGNGTFTVKAGSHSNVASGLIFFVGTSTAGNASFVIEGGERRRLVAFFGSDLEKPTAGNAIFNINGSTILARRAGLFSFPAAQRAVLPLLQTRGQMAASGGISAFSLMTRVKLSSNSSAARSR